MARASPPQLFGTHSRRAPAKGRSAGQLDPQSWGSRVTYFRLGRRATCRDRPHHRRRDGSNLDQLCHLRDCVSALIPRHLRPVARVGQLLFERNRISTLSSASVISLMECGCPGNFLFLSCQRSNLDQSCHQRNCDCSMKGSEFVF